MEMFEHLNDHLVMKYHKSRSADLIAEARRERLKREVLQRAAEERQTTQVSVIATLWRRVRTLWQRERPAVKQTISLVDERGY